MEKGCAKGLAEKGIIEDIAKNLCFNIGVPNNITGYRFLIESVIRVYFEPMAIDYITVSVYEYVAEIFGVPTARVERDMRYLVAKTWKIGDQELIKEIFGTMRKPTNSEFIIKLVKAVRNHVG
jgi:hypothetical protein